MAAKQYGTHSLSGTLGDVTYSQTKAGFRAKQRTRVNMTERMTGAKFQAWRDHTSEFGLVLKEAKILRNAFMDLNWNVDNKSLVQQTVQIMNKIRKTDAVNERGQRRPSTGDLSLLKDFDFSGISNVNQIIKGGFTTTFDRSTGVALVTIKEMVPKELLSAPATASHFMLTLAVASVNFETGEVNKRMISTPKLLIDGNTLPETVLTETHPAIGTDPVIIVLKMEYYSHVNGKFLSIMGNADISSTIIHVDQE
jgi:hypothetical protein